jgi:hypothetical protein
MDCRFRDMFWRIAAKRCKKVAYVAVARKLLTVVWHLLVNGECYVEEGFSKKKCVLARSRSAGGDSGGGLSLDVIAGILGRAVRRASDVDGG